MLRKKNQKKNLKFFRWKSYVIRSTQKITKKPNKKKHPNCLNATMLLKFNTIQSLLYYSLKNIMQFVAFLYNLVSYVLYKMCYCHFFLL